MTSAIQSAGLQNSTFLQMAHQCADGQGGMLQTQFDDRLSCLWAERPADSFVPATLTLQRPKTLCSPLVEPAFERTGRVAMPTPVQLRGQSQRPTKGVALV